MFLTLSVKAKNYQCLNYVLQEYETRVVSKGLEFISQLLDNQQSLVEVCTFFFFHSSPLNWSMFLPGSLYHDAKEIKKTN